MTDDRSKWQRGAWPSAAALPPYRRLFLQDYILNIGIGAHDFEKQAPQRVIINVELFVSLAGSTPQNDDLSEVVDYDFIRSCITQCLHGGHIQLQETLVDAALELLMQHPKVAAARISSAKPDVYPDCAAVGVEVMGYKP